MSPCLMQDFQYRVFRCRIWMIGSFYCGVAERKNCVRENRVLTEEFFFVTQDGTDYRKEFESWMDRL
jgi:hypothetical protein